MGGFLGKAADALGKLLDAGPVRGGLLSLATPVIRRRFRVAYRTSLWLASVSVDVSISLGWLLV